MFTDLFEELYSQLGSAAEQLRAMQDTSAAEKLNELTELQHSLKTVTDLSRSQQEKEASGESRISQNDARELSDAFRSFSDKSKAFAEKYSKAENKSSELNALLIPLSNLSVPTGQFSRVLNDAAEGNIEKHHSLKDVFSDVSWTGEILHPDPAIKKKYDTATAQWNLKEKSAEESFGLYRDALNEAGNSYREHYQTISGSSDFEKAIGYKFRMVAAALGDSRDDRELKDRILSFAPDIKLKQKRLIPDQIDKDNVAGFNESYFEHKVNSRYDQAFISGLTERSSLTGGKDDLLKMIRDVTPRPHLLGIDEKTFGTLNSSGDFLDIFNGSVDPFVSSMLKSRQTAELPEVKHIAQLNERLKSKCADFLQNKGESPTTEDYASLMDALTELTSKIPAQTKTKSGYVVNSCYELGMRINDTVPGLEGRFKALTQVYRQKEESFYRDAQEFVLTHADDLTALNKQMEAVERYTDSVPDASRANYNYVYYTALFVNPDFAAQELDRKEKELEHFKESGEFGPQRSFGMREKVSEENGVSRETAKKDRERRTLVSTAGETLLCRYAMMEGDARAEDAPAPDKKAISEMVRNFERNKGIKKLLKSESNTICDSFVPDNPADRAKIEKAQTKLIYDRFPKLNADCTRVMTESSRLLGMSNSESYNAVSQAIKKINGAEPPRLEDYERLYNTLVTYVKEHDSNPSTKQGQMRFQASARLLADVGMTLAEEKPELRESVQKDFGVTMMRCTQFRDYIAARAVRKASKHTDMEGFCQDLIKGAAAVNNALNKDETPGMLTGSIQNEQQYENLLKKFDELVSAEPVIRHRDEPIPEKKKSASAFVL